MPKMRAAGSTNAASATAKKGPSFLEDSACWHKCNRVCFSPLLLHSNYMTCCHVLWISSCYEHLEITDATRSSSVAEARCEARNGRDHSHALHVRSMERGGDIGNAGG